MRQDVFRIEGGRIARCYDLGTTPDLLSLEQKTRRTLSEMARLARARHVHPLVVETARAIASGIPHDQSAQAEAVMRFMREELGYVKDPLGSEWISDPLVVIEDRAPVNCDGSTTQAALLMAIGIPARFVAWSPNEQTEFKHVYVQAYTGGQWRNADWTATDIRQRQMCERTGRRLIRSIEPFPGGRGLGHLTVIQGADLGGFGEAEVIAPEAWPQVGVSSEGWPVLQGVFPSPEEVDEEDEMMAGLIDQARETRALLEQVPLSQAVLARIPAEKIEAWNGNLDRLQRELAIQLQLIASHLSELVDWVVQVQENDLDPLVEPTLDAAIVYGEALDADFQFLSALFVASSVIRSMGREGIIRAAIAAKDELPEEIQAELGLVPMIVGIIGAVVVLCYGINQAAIVLGPNTHLADEKIDAESEAARIRLENQRAINASREQIRQEVSSSMIQAVERDDQKAIAELQAMLDELNRQQAEGMENEQRAIGQMREGLAQAKVGEIPWGWLIGIPVAGLTIAAGVKIFKGKSR